MDDALRELQDDPRYHCLVCNRFLFNESGKLIKSVTIWGDVRGICLECLRKEILGNFAPLIAIAPDIESLTVRHKDFILDVDMAGKKRKIFSKVKRK